MLKQLDSQNGLFATLRSQWASECEAFNEDVSEYAAPHFNHAEGICQEHPTDPRYGIYALQGSSGSFDCLMHINRARLPGTIGETLRIVWILLAPRFDFAEGSPIEFAKIAAGVIGGAISLAKSAQTTHIKIHLGNLGDREFFTAVAATLGPRAMFADIGVRGNWLHLSP